MLLRFIVGFFIFLAWLVFARQYYFCTIKGNCGDREQVVDTTLLNNIPYTLQLTTEDSVLLKGFPQFCFKVGSNEAIMTDAHTDFLKKTASIVNNAHSSRLTLVITGRFKASEQPQKNLSKNYNDLGTTRGQTAAQLLADNYNLNVNNIRVTSEIQSESENWQQLSFHLEGFFDESIDINQEDTALLKQIKTSVEDITYTDKNANFDYDSGNFRPGKSFDIYIDSLKSYFVQHPNDYLVITGHTDSKGNSTYNRKLGLKRAKSVRNYLLKHGLIVEIKTLSEGSDELLFNDQYDDGSYNLEAMSKNRRVNIKIKQP